MSLLAILISLALEKLLPHICGLCTLTWFDLYQSKIRAKLEKHERLQGIPSLLIIVLLPVFGVAIIQYFLNDLLALFGFLFSVIVLTFCLGPEDEHRRVNEYLDAVDNDDNERAQNALSEVLQAGGRNTNTENGAIETNDETTRINRLIESILIITHDRMLAILFWFVILGPMGAILYRLTLALFQHKQTQIEQSPENGEHDANASFNHAVNRLHHLLSWIPAHLTALSYAVMGSFVHALRAWQEQSSESLDDNANNADISTDNSDAPPEATSASTNHHLLLRIGLASLQFDTKPPQDNDAVRETLGLCGRSLVAWITLLAIMTLAGWAS